MADDDSSQEKTEDPTEKRKEDARKKGQVARSKELGTAVVMMAGAIGLYVASEPIIVALTEVFKSNYMLSRASIYDFRAPYTFLLDSAYKALTSLTSLFIILFIAAVIGPGLTGGWLFSADSIKPKFSRMNPLSGMKRIFSVKGLVEMLKAFAKFLVVGATSVFLINYFIIDILSLSSYETLPAIASGVDKVAACFFVLCSSLLLIAAVDVPFQIHQHNKQLKMTKQQVKDEMKDSEGKPEVKGRIRQLQMEMAQRRMMSDVPDADVVITNPTHFSVALKYNELMAAPIVLAKGVDETALKIREIANAHELVIVEAPPLARALYHTTAIGNEIHADLYVSVAQVLAYVYQLNMYAKGEGPLPDEVNDFEVPRDMRYDAEGQPEPE